MTYARGSVAISTGNRPLNHNDTFPARGERIATWVEAHMAAHGLSVGELAFKVRADKRDIRRLLHERSCGPRLNDDLERVFGWDFIEQVATPVVGADPVTARERDLERRQAEVSAIHARLIRERNARASEGAVSVVRGRRVVPALQVGRKG